MTGSVTRMTTLEGFRANREALNRRSPHDGSCESVRLGDLLPEEAQFARGTFEITITFTPEGKA